MERENNLYISESPVLFNSTDEVLEQYGELFQKEDDLYLEKSHPEKEDVFRIVLTDSIAYVISAFNTNEIWNLDDKNKSNLLKEATEFAHTKLDSTTNVKEQIHTFFSGNQYYLVRVLPYGVEHNSSVLRCILDRKALLMERGY
ncbi:hypothetical protein GX888_01775 [Candidatus Dojkabacteria bacterium]|uniref:Uncharacterized protein n=1 Tax=Candidatus Dojkabacteria bacterium TaxID=2099670 RepID=A0A847VD42_9BACT|nr:hypothetical protein [Candidatus Dojkabacteria bacterium]